MSLVCLVKGHHPCDGFADCNVDRHQHKLILHCLHCGKLIDWDKSSKQEQWVLSD